MAAGCNPQGGAALCPAHPDRNKSLSYSFGQDDDRVLIHCHAGCTVDAVLAALGLSQSDLFDDSGAPGMKRHSARRNARPSGTSVSRSLPQKARPARTEVERYQYVNSSGDRLYQIIRYSDKSFALQPKGTKLRVLYRLDEVAKAVRDGDTVFVVEGEKDADRLRAKGFTATTSPFGAGKWGKGDYAKSLKGAASVVIVADRDPTGYDHAADVHHSIVDHVGDVVIAQAREGKDVSDHLDAGLSVEDLERLELGDLAVPDATSDADEQPVIQLHSPAPRHLPEDFWSARAVLGEIRRAAHGRQRSGDAVFHAVLARVAASVPHTVKLPPTVGTSVPLCYFCVMLAGSGGGKGGAQGIGAELVPGDEMALGSGEGIVEALFDFVKEEDPPGSGKLVSVKKQMKFNALISVDEGETLNLLGGRSGSTLLPTLRTIYTGGQLGQSNASNERKRIVPAGQYSYGVVMGLQLLKAGLLLDDYVGGTPQRFAWTLLADPTIQRADGRGLIVPLDWRPPGPGVLADFEVRSSHVQYHMELAGSVKAAILAADLLVAQGLGSPDPFEGHANLLRLKVAGLLALLDGRMNVTEEDWQLGCVVGDTSTAVRQYAQDVVAEEARGKERDTSERLARRQVAGTAAVDGWRIIEAAKRIRSKVDANPDGITARTVQQALRRWRDEFSDALEYALNEGWIVERHEHGQGDDRRTLYPA
jgi:hypothetical protein